MVGHDVGLRQLPLVAGAFPAPLAIIGLAQVAEPPTACGRSNQMKRSQMRKQKAGAQRLTRGDGELLRVMRGRGAPGRRLAIPQAKRYAAFSADEMTHCR